MAGKSVKKVFYILWQVILSLLILLGIPFFVPMGFVVLQEVDPLTAYQLAIFGPWSLYTWLVLFAILISAIWFPVVLVLWVLRDAVKFKVRGINTSPLFWGIGMVLPTIVIVFPIYFIFRKIIWPGKLKANN